MKQYGMYSRQMYVDIWQELSKEKSMIFLAGPRQSGKTTLAKMIARSYPNNLYFNWDIADHRMKFMEDSRFFEGVERKNPAQPLIILDEIHKYKDWKNYLKGVYDQFHEDYRFLISGSGRLDIYQKGGDSLAGRYFLFHLWPLTLSELGQKNVSMEDFLKNPLHLTMNKNAELKVFWKNLSTLSGFPEPFASGKVITYRRWSNTYSSQLIREDIRDLIDIKSVQELETLYLLLPSKVGSPLSVPSLANDLKVSYNSVRSWLSILERFFLIFSIPTWTAKISRAIQKERKVYLWDSPRIKDEAARFENMVAIELWRAVTLWNDMGHGTFSLHFIRNKEKQEVDFLIASDNVPFLLVETKLSDTQPLRALKEFQRKLNVPAVQLSGSGEGYRIITNESNKILIAPACQWLAQLP